MNRYAALEKKLGIKFKNKDLLDQAFVHTSYVNEHRAEKKEDNERFEFLGDAVLELVSTEFLFRTFPDVKEGELTSFRSALVKGRHLAQVASQLELGFLLYLSQGEIKSGGQKKALILANTLEALIGAIYLDRGFKTAHKFIDAFILKNLGAILTQRLHIDAKSRFQELSQERLRLTPLYRVISEEGPDHNRTFTMGAYLGHELVATGKGSSKQKAEQDAAFNALKAKSWD